MRRWAPVAEVPPGLRASWFRRRESAQPERRRPDAAPMLANMSVSSCQNAICISSLHRSAEHNGRRSSQAPQHQYLIMIEAFHQICSVDLVNLANAPAVGMFTLGN
jgi:hypothetical protein